MRIVYDFVGPIAREARESRSSGGAWWTMAEPPRKKREYLPFDILSIIGFLLLMPCVIIGLIAGTPGIGPLHAVVGIVVISWIPYYLYRCAKLQEDANQKLDTMCRTLERMADQQPAPNPDQDADDFAEFVQERHEG